MMPQKTLKELMDSGEWKVPCERDTGKDRFNQVCCASCLAAGGGDSLPYCMTDYYAELAEKERLLKAVHGPSTGS